MSHVWYGFENTIQHILKRQNQSFIVLLPHEQSRAAKMDKFPNRLFDKKTNNDMCIAISEVYRIIKKQPNIVRDSLVYKDTVRKIALLRYSAAFKIRSGYTRETQGWNINEGYKYFRAVTSVATMVSTFFNSNEEHMKYSLLVDCTTYVHSCMLFIRRIEGVPANQPSYVFHAFDPNTTCISECFSRVAKQIGAVDTIKVWSTKKGNTDAVCFGLNWRFIYSIMVEGHDPMENEKIVGLFKVSSNRASPYPNGKKVVSSVGYIKGSGRGSHYKPTKFIFSPTKSKPAST